MHWSRIFGQTCVCSGSASRRSGVVYKAWSLLVGSTAIAGSRGVKPRGALGLITSHHSHHKLESTPRHTNRTKGQVKMILE